MLPLLSYTTGSFSLSLVISSLRYRATAAGLSCCAVRLANIFKSTANPAMTSQMQSRICSSLHRNQARDT